MLVELCACLHCDVLDLPHVLVAVSICDLSLFWARQYGIVYQYFMVCEGSSP